MAMSKDSISVAFSRSDHFLPSWNLSLLVFPLLASLFLLSLICSTVSSFFLVQILGCTASPFDQSLSYPWAVAPASVVLTITSSLMTRPCMFSRHKHLQMWLPNGRLHLDVPWTSLFQTCPKPNLLWSPLNLLHPLLQTHLMGPLVSGVGSLGVILVSVLSLSSAFNQLPIWPFLPYTYFN